MRALSKHGLCRWGLTALVALAAACHSPVGPVDAGQLQTSAPIPLTPPSAPLIAVRLTCPTRISFWTWTIDGRGDGIAWAFGWYGLVAEDALNIGPDSEPGLTPAVHTFAWREWTGFVDFGGQPTGNAGSVQTDALGRVSVQWRCGSA